MWLCSSNSEEKNKSDKFESTKESTSWVWPPALLKAGKMANLSLVYFKRGHWGHCFSNDKKPSLCRLPLLIQTFQRNKDRSWDLGTAEPGTVLVIFSVLSWKIISSKLLERASYIHMLQNKLLLEVFSCIGQNDYLTWHTSCSKAYSETQ